jgi:hypothetical protein
MMDDYIAVAEMVINTHRPLPCPRIIYFFFFFLVCTSFLFISFLLLAFHLALSAFITDFFSSDPVVFHSSESPIIRHATNFGHIRCIGISISPAVIATVLSGSCSSQL